MTRPNFGPGFYPGHPREEELRQLVNKVSVCRAYLRTNPTRTVLWDTLERYAREGRALAREMYNVEEPERAQERSGEAADLPPEDAGARPDQTERVGAGGRDSEGGVLGRDDETGGAVERPWVAYSADLT